MFLVPPSDFQSVEDSKIDDNNKIQLLVKNKRHCILFIYNTIYRYFTHNLNIPHLFHETLTIPPVHYVVLVKLEVLVQPHELGDPPHPRDDEAEGEGVSAQGAVALRHQDAVDELEAEGEAVMVVLVEPNRQVDRRTAVMSNKWLMKHPGCVW